MELRGYKGIGVQSKMEKVYKLQFWRKFKVDSLGTTLATWKAFSDEAVYKLFPQYAFGHWIDRQDYGATGKTIARI